MTVGKANTSTDEQMAEYFQRASGEEVTVISFLGPQTGTGLGGLGILRFSNRERERGGGGRERQTDRERERE